MKGSEPDLRRPPHLRRHPPHPRPHLLLAGPALVSVGSVVLFALVWTEDRIVHSACDFEF